MILSLNFKSVWEYKNQPREIVIFAYIKLSKVINFITHLVADNHAIIKAVHQVRNTLQLLCTSNISNFEQSMSKEHK